ncbi:MULTISPECIES: alpha/beta fold hydrolase [unclassified Rhizobium]|uniref:alpha/beta fold hydrolase n=1 Tax=unclassified Rhizobium TaxID=2613769 RepID=UPI000BC464D4|nr:MULTISPECIES: alpha/beta fold hydrolase [unclassified Rhizobium]MDH7809995.1 pimeloyl-ACP methyl ester carboxylesterase [Rhizobium sp. AN67]SOD51193.1 Pimeloyl-ACP methyl ester carboxylesterase [Rhizobium sp. AN6A]
MDFEHVTFDLPHGTFHALQGGDPDGQPTIVLHGFPDHPPTAKPFLAELGRRGRHVVAPWLRGYAQSPTAGLFDFAALTSDVLALIDRWSPGRPVELIGHDWGALITYDTCVTAPERIARAVALSIPHPLTFMSRLAHPAELCRSWYMGLFQLPGSGWIATARDLALIDHLYITACGLVAEPILCHRFVPPSEAENRKPAAILSIVKSYKPIIIQFVIDEIKRGDNDQIAVIFGGGMDQQNIHCGTHAVARLTRVRGRHVTAFEPPGRIVLTSNQPNSIQCGTT